MSTPDRPNILVFFTDQQRWDTVGAYCSPLDLTPNLDAVARRGTTFLNAFTCQPVCGPARAVLQTGRYATQTGCWRNAIPLPDDARTIAHELGDAGYRTGYIGKWHLGRRREYEPVPLAERGGWNQFWEAADVLEFASRPHALRLWDADGHEVRGRGYRVDAQTDRVIGFLNSTGDEPWAMMVSYLEPHHQNNLNRYVAPDGYADRYRNAWVPEDLRPFPGDWPSQWPEYCGIIRNLDENFGRLVNELDRLGQLERTVIIFVTDHGSHFCTRNSEYKRTCHESAVRIPLIVAGPGFDHGRRAHELVSLVDLPPTICQIAGTSGLQGMVGRPLQALAERPPAEWRDDVFIQISESGIARALRTGRWKYCITAPQGVPNGPYSEQYVESHLYDLWADPHELTNLVGRRDLRPLADELQQRLVAHMRAAGEPAATITPGRFA